MKTVTIVLLSIFALTVSPTAQALMSPDGAMVQMDSYDEAEQLVAEKQYEEAIKKLKAILREHPGHANAWNALGFSQRMTGDLDAATTSYTNALTITPSHKGALNYMGQMFVQTGRMEEARDMLVKLEAACGQDCEEYQQLSTAIKDGKAGNY